MVFAPKQHPKSGVRATDKQAEQEDFHYHPDHFAHPDKNVQDSQGSQKQFAHPDKNVQLMHKIVQDSQGSQKQFAHPDKNVQLMHKIVQDSQGSQKQFAHPDKNVQLMRKIVQDSQGSQKQFAHPDKNVQLMRKIVQDSQGSQKQFAHPDKNVQLMRKIVQDSQGSQKQFAHPDKNVQLMHKIMQASQGSTDEIQPKRAIESTDHNNKQQADEKAERVQHPIPSSSFQGDASEVESDSSTINKQDLMQSAMDEEANTMNNQTAIIPEELASPNDYPYKFNGMDADNEVKGIGNVYDFGARIYDPRMGRWLRFDPLAADFPTWSDYNYVLGNPINLVDPDGKAPGDPPYKISNGVLSGHNVTNSISQETYRPPMKSINSIVLHRTVSSSASGSIRHAKKLKGSVGFHIIVGKNGDVTQINNMNNRANHVGKQKGDVGNYNSIGIEVVGMPVDKYGNPTMGTDRPIVGWETLTNEQIESTAQAVFAIMNEYDISLESIFPHEDVSWKTAGEGQVVYDAILGRLNELLNPPVEETEQNATPVTVDTSRLPTPAVQDNTYVAPSALGTNNIK